VWDRYRSDGDGFFSASGFTSQLEMAAIPGRVLPGAEVGADDRVLGVIAPARDDEIYLLPDFNLAAPALAPWFDGRDTSSRNSPVQRVVRPAMLSRRREGTELQRGEVA
jgi:hypothetical protein